MGSSFTVTLLVEAGGVFVLKLLKVGLGVAKSTKG